MLILVCVLCSILAAVLAAYHCKAVGVEREVYTTLFVFLSAVTGPFGLASVIVVMLLHSINKDG